MLTIENVWSSGPNLDITFSVALPNIDVQIGGVSTSIMLPATNSQNMSFAQVTFGKVSQTIPCNWCQTTYNDSEYLPPPASIEHSIGELLDIRWYRGDMIHANSNTIKFIQGYIGKQMNEPVTARTINNGSSDLVFQFGDVIDISDILYGRHDNADVSILWWDYMKVLMQRKVFEADTFKRIHNILIKVYEKNGFETKG